MILVSSRPSWPTYWVPGQSGWCTEMSKGRTSSHHSPASSWVNPSVSFVQTPYPSHPPESVHLLHPMPSLGFFFFFFFYKKEKPSLPVQQPTFRLWQGAILWTCLLWFIGSFHTTSNVSTQPHPAHPSAGLSSVNPSDSAFLTHSEASP